MSYRAFKRLLGETSLERKSLLLLGTVSLLLITSSFLVYAKLTERIAYNQTINSGRLLVLLLVRKAHDQDTASRQAMETFESEAEQRWPKAITDYKSVIIKPNSPKPAILA